jgi:antitoxin HicB
MQTHTYKLLLNKEPEGGFTVNVPALPGCITYGNTLDEAISNAREAIELYIETLVEDGEPIPDDKETLEYSLTLTS